MDLGSNVALAHPSQLKPEGHIVINVEVRKYRVVLEYQPQTPLLGWKTRNLLSIQQN